jgi:SAM-dependent methyltransferase
MAGRSGTSRDAGPLARRRRRAREPSPSRPAPALRAERSPAHARFLRLDRDRARREWTRYEGTAQRELFRQLRERFLARHAGTGPWALDAGAGPGRFSPSVGAPSSRHVALDLSRAMLLLGRELGASRSELTGVDRVLGDAAKPPFRPGTFSEVALVGNALGFEVAEGAALLASVEALVAPGGTLLVEVAPGPGERSRYLSRLPPGAVRRLLGAPVAAVLPRVVREGFRTEPERHSTSAFRRWSPKELLDRWGQLGWVVREVVAVAPALGPDAERLEEIAQDPKAWSRLLELEETVGVGPARWPSAAAVLLAVARRAVETNGFLPGATSLVT